MFEPSFQLNESLPHHRFGMEFNNMQFINRKMPIIYLDEKEARVSSNNDFGMCKFCMHFQFDMIVFIAHYVTIFNTVNVSMLLPRSDLISNTGMEFKKRFPSLFLAGGESQVCRT